MQYAARAAGRETALPYPVWKKGKDIRMKPLSFIIIGSGWRAMFYARIARRFPEQFRLMYMLCRSEEKAARIARDQGILTTLSVEECEKARPDFVVAAVSKTSMFQVTKEWVQKGFAVLCETPAGMDTGQLKELWQLKEQQKARIQTAEQYFRYPILAAGLRAVRQGKLGDPYGVRLSAAHDYHGASLIRHMLQIKPGPVKMWGKTYGFPVRETDSRYGAVTDGSVKERERTCIAMEFAAGKIAYYDFSGVQYHSFIRSRHVNVQGRDGEWNDTILRYVKEDHTPEKEQLLLYLSPRYEELESEALRRAAQKWNPVLELDQEQDEYAVACILFDMRDYIETGKETYPLAEALEDAYLWILMQKAAENPQTVMNAEAMPWWENPVSPG